MKTSNHIKTLLLALTLVFAIGFSAFKNQAPATKVPKALKAGAISSDYIVQPATNVFREFLLTGMPDDGECFGSATKECVYHVTALGKLNIPAEPTNGYTAQNITDYLDDEWIEEVESTNPSLFTGDYRP